MGLLRRAKQRRRKFAESIQNSARSERQKQINRGSSFSSTTSSMGGLESPVVQSRDPRTMMPPPMTPMQKRQSLPADFDSKQSQFEISTRTKRKREEHDVGADQVTPRRTKIHHKRSGTVGDSIMSAPPRPITRTPYKSRMDVSKVKEGSLLNDILMQQARRLAPHARSDTTRTDYFELKALGIDPDTSVVPSTEKRTRDEEDLDGAENSMRASSPNPRASHSTRIPDSQPATQTQYRSAKVSKIAEDNDEELFAQIRSVREALAESEQWCKSERESLEKSMTPQPKTPPNNKETPAQRRLRELRERGPTPSRSEIRLRAMGDKALLPKGFWDGEGMGMSLMASKKGEAKGKGKDPATRPLFPPPQSWKREQVGARTGAALRGFAALEKRGQTNGFTNGPRQAAQTEKQMGLSAEDAIEL